MIPIIRTSDRTQFRKCRQKWDWGSKIRQNWEWVPGVEPLDFGVAVHAGMDVYYDPRRWNDPRALVCYEAINAFIYHLEEWKQRLQRADQWVINASRWHELMGLGIGMLEHYFMWAPRHDKEWTPVRSEVEFEVPIRIPDAWLSWVDNASSFSIGRPTKETPYYFLLMWSDEADDFVPVLYQGRIDLIVQFSNGKYGIVDHKTAAQFGQTEHLELDTQTRSYAWACWKQLGLDVELIIYNELRKAVPGEPRVLKSGYLSKNKNQGTTVELYIQKIQQLGHDPSYYADFIPLLQAHQTEYFRRTEVSYSQGELDQTELCIFLEAMDMLDSPFIYPNPDRWNCNGCQFRTPCLLKQEGGDFEYHLRESGLYVKRD